MDLKTVGTVFVALFLAELGDKTQLAVLSFTAGGRGVWSVFLGASLALVASTAFAIVVGRGLLEIIPAEYLRLGSAALFIVVGVLLAVESIGALRSG